LRNAQIVNLTVAEAFETFVHPKFNYIFTDQSIVDSIDVLRELPHQWWIELARSGTLPTWTLALPRYLKSFCHHGYPDLVPRFQGSNAAFDKSMAVYGFIHKVMDKGSQEIERRRKRLNAARRSNDEALLPKLRQYVLRCQSDGALSLWDMGFFE
jgi:hypothetical protein